MTESVHNNVEAQAKLHLPGSKAFVPQDDRLHGFYTTRSYLHHYARLSGISQQLKPEQVNERIDKLLQQCCVGLNHIEISSFGTEYFTLILLIGIVDKLAAWALGRVKVGQEKMIIMVVLMLSLVGLVMFGS